MKKELEQRIQVLSTLVTRMQLAGQLGLSYDGDRDLYDILGYKADLTYNDFYLQWKRQDIAKAIINRPISTTWRGPLQILEVDDAEVTPFEKAWEELATTLKIKSKFIALDRFTGLGRYGVLFFGFNDVQSSTQFETAVQGTNNRLLYVRALNEVDCQVVEYEEDVRNERYGSPKIYSVTLKNAQGASETMRVHHTRILHVVDSPVENDHFGTPRLEAVYNRLQDLEKLTGGSAEMFWRGARPGYNAKVDPEYTLSTEDEDALEEQIEQFEHNLKRIFYNEGVSLETLAQQVSDPKNHVDVQIQMISAETGIPKRILTGSERGELSSGQDADEWNAFIQTRREEFAELLIVRPFIDVCIKYGVLPKPTANEGIYSVAWQDLFSISEKDKIEVGGKRTEALTKYAAQPEAHLVVPPQAFFEMFLGLTPDQVTLIAQMREEALKEEMKRQEQDDNDMFDEEDEDEPEEDDEIIEEDDTEE